MAALMSLTDSFPGATPCNPYATRTPYGVGEGAGATPIVSMDIGQLSCPAEMRRCTR